MTIVLRIGAVEVRYIYEQIQSRIATISVTKDLCR